MKRLAAACALVLAARAAALEPKAWERRTLPAAPVSVLIPVGSIEQPRGQNRPGFDEVEKGWLLQSLEHHKGSSRFILYLAAGSIAVNYHQGDTLSGYETLDAYIKNYCTGKPWGEDQVGKWKGFRTRTVGRKSSGDYGKGEPYGVTVAYGVEFGRSEYLTVQLDANPGAVSGYLPYFIRIRDSLLYAPPR